MASYPWDEAARLYVGSAPAQSGSLGELAAQWAALPDGKDKEDAHITMVYKHVSLPGTPDGKQYATLQATELALIAAALPRR